MLVHPHRGPGQALTIASPVGRAAHVLKQSLSLIMVYPPDTLSRIGPGHRKLLLADRPVVYTAVEALSG